MSLKEQIEEMMRRGAGYEDIIATLRITDPTMKQLVRAYVLDRRRDDKE